MPISRVTSAQYDAPGPVPVVSAAGTPPAAQDADVESVADAVRRIAADAAREDAAEPLDEATRLSLRHHGLADQALWVARDAAGSVTGFALAARDGDQGTVEMNLVVAPAARGAGVGRALAREVLDAFPDAPVTAWSHGDHPAASRLAQGLGFERARDLWRMRRPLSADHPLPEVTPTDGAVVRTFRPGEDEDAFLAVNAEAFIDHPEQGSMNRADLDLRMAEPWFDPEGFFVAEPADAPSGVANEIVDSPSLLGFHWTKVHDERVGEVYVVGMSPDAQGRGLGRTLTLTGLHHLRDRGLAEVVLYVEADNTAAITLYSALGFTHADEDTDVQYARGAQQ
jgi:mycothiol synthase